MKTLSSCIYILIILLPVQVFCQEGNKIEESSTSGEYGSKISIEKINGEIVKGELLSVRQNSILLLPIYKPESSVIEYIDLVEVFEFNDLNKVTIITESDFGTSCLIIGGTAIGGGIIGALVGASVERSGGTEKVLSGAGGGLIGLLIGLAIGIVINILVTSDEVIDIKQDFDYTMLISYARFQGMEPDYLRKIE